MSNYCAPPLPCDVERLCSPRTRSPGARNRTDWSPSALDTCTNPWLLRTQRLWLDDSEGLRTMAHRSVFPPRLCHLKTQYACAQIAFNCVFLADFGDVSSFYHVPASSVKSATGVLLIVYQRGKAVINGGERTWSDRWSGTISSHAHLEGETKHTSVHCEVRWCRE